MSLLIVLVFVSSIEYEADPFKGFYFLLSLQTVAAKNRRYQGDFIQILHEDVMLFVVIDDHIYDFNPAMQSSA